MSAVVAAHGGILVGANKVPAMHLVAARVKLWRLYALRSTDMCEDAQDHNADETDDHGRLYH